MTDKVPGGRQRAVSEGDILDDEEDDGGFTGYPLNDSHRKVSQSLELSHTLHRVNHNVSMTPSEYGDNITTKKKKSIRRSFMKMMKRMWKVDSNTTTKPRSQSMPLDPRVTTQGTGPGGRRNSLVESTENHPAPSASVPNGYTPGISGIKNHGNTCFMNAVVQCLSNTDCMAEYFVTDQYREDLMRRNKLAKKFGSKGEITDQFANLLKSLWACKYTPDISSEFKSVIGKFASQYRGYSQHDAQEFLLWLLDKVHEDLNIAPKKKYKVHKSMSHKSEEVAAEAALANHNRCNNSFVYDLFQALYRSSLSCPHCKQQSNTFDPFVCVSLPIPQKSTRPVFVTVVYLNSRPKLLKMGLTLDVAANIKDLREEIALKTNIPVTQIILTEVTYSSFHRTFHDDQPLSDIHEQGMVWALETPPVHKNKQEIDTMLVVLNTTGSEDQGKRFGSPLVLLVSRESTYPELQDEILSHLADCVNEGANSQQWFLYMRKRLGVLFRLKVVDGIPGKSYLPQDVELPLFMQTIDRVLSCHTPGSGPIHVKMIAEWNPETKQSVLNNQTEDTIQEHPSVQHAKSLQQKPVTASLDQCFQLYTKEEKLGPEDAWHCPNCKKLQQGTIKKLNLWSLPDILVVHLKRFRQTGVRRIKLNTLVEFPVHKLDMSPHVVKRHSSQSHWSPWRRHRRSASAHEDTMYDLYAVCNHYGNMMGGHYTAFCKNPSNGQWYSFDDSQVTPVNENQLITPAAYLLFYQRRSFNHHSSASSTSSGGSDHWTHRLPTFQYTPKITSQSHENLLDGDGETRLENARIVQAYATMRRPVKPRPSNPTLDTSPVPAYVDHDRGAGDSGIANNYARNNMPGNGDQHHNNTPGSPTKITQNAPCSTADDTEEIHEPRVRHNSAHEYLTHGVNLYPKQNVVSVQTKSPTRGQTTSPTHSPVRPTHINGYGTSQFQKTQKHISPVSYRKTIDGATLSRHPSSSPPTPLATKPRAVAAASITSKPVAMATKSVQPVMHTAPMNCKPMIARSKSSSASFNDDSSHQSSPASYKKKRMTYAYLQESCV